MIRQSWWKILGVVLVLYSIIVGMLVPLGPGISRVTPSAADTGDTLNLRVEGYNSHYQSASGSMRAWLKLNDELALGAQRITVIDERTVDIRFQIPAFLPVRDRVKNLTLLIDNARDGSSVLPNAVFITQDSIRPELGEAQWPNAPIKELTPRNGITFPFLNILGESIRNTYFHVPLWLAMVMIFAGSVLYSARYLRGGNLDDDSKAMALTRIGVLYGVLGVVTGAVWAKFTWGAFWSWDVKQNMTAVALLIYFAYFILRNSFDDMERSARISAVYNIFAFVALIPLIYVIPRLTDSLHPGAGGNPAFGSQDLDNTMRMVFYPAVIGWTLIGYWISSLVYRSERLRIRMLDL